MIKAIIIDDEKPARFMLRNLLETQLSNDIEILAEADDVDTGLTAILSHQPDLVFLDIQMPQGTGFDLLEQLEEVNFEVIFITAYNDYAVKAFQFSAFDYLMKPIKSDALMSTIEKLKEHLVLLRENTGKRLKVLVESYDDEKIRKLVINGMEGFKVFELNDIYYLSGNRNYTDFVVEGHSKMTASKTLGEYEALLTDHGFFRIHQGSLINLRHVKEYRKGDGGSVIMKNGDELKVSRQRKADFVSRFL